MKRENKEKKIRNNFGFEKFRVCMMVRDEDINTNPELWIKYSIRPYKLARF